MKLGQGCFIQVSSPLIKRQKVHFVNLPNGISIILGRNGFIWVTTTAIQESSRKSGGFTPLLKVNLRLFMFLNRSSFAHVII
jgi:exosome complex component RRP4